MANRKNVLISFSISTPVLVVGGVFLLWKFLKGLMELLED